MKLAIAMLVAYLPFFWWMYKQALEDMEKAKSKRKPNETVLVEV